MKVVNIIIFCFASHLLMAQKPPIKFGDVSMEEMNMKVYDMDTSASAVILADYAESSIIYNSSMGFSLLFERITRIKILKKEGYKWADFEIPLYHDGANKEKLSSLKGFTYNLEKGKIVPSKLGKEGIFEEEVNENLDNTKVALPDVKEGCVVEISYKVLSDFFTHFQGWYFQNQIPIMWSEYRARIPEYFTYDKYMQGYIGLHINETKTYSGSYNVGGGDRVDFQENNFRWVSKDVPAFKMEPYMTTFRDYISRINFELAYIKFPQQAVKTYMKDWDDIKRRFHESENMGAQVKANGFLKKIAEDITIGASSEEQKVGMVYNYIKTQVSWDNSSRIYTYKPMRKVLDEKKGNSAELNLLLASMLEKLGFKVSPVLISTRDHGFVRQNIPVSSQFNYTLCMVQIGNQNLLLDVTDKFLPIGLLPERCLNGVGLVISEGPVQWINLQSNQKSRKVVEGEFLLDETGVLKGLYKVSYEGHSAVDSRKSFFSKGEEDFVKDFVIGSNPWEVEKSEFEHTKELNEPFVQKMNLTISDFSTSAGSVMYVNPFITLRKEENPFKLEKREYPVDFASPWDEVYLVKIQIPEGYEIEELPQSKAMALPGNSARYIYNVSMIGKTINIMSNLAINKALFSQLEYPNLREFYNLVVAKQAEQIVLKKK